MKRNKIKLLGIIAIVAIIGLSMIGCAKGGTLEIKNSTGEDDFECSYAVGSISNITDAMEEEIDKNAKSVKNGESAKWTFDEDTDIVWYWKAKGGNFNSDEGDATIAEGETVTITAK